ncbi:hypothetical protein A1O1_07728 [Capronia coronata CBS 617.96]|uniref:Uncharacterized protein n=1 Tax=Capronia coronata CBS 617.96 TaxID=1182541 RepID=W9XN60_9EURO|nr:uncharacterized protein A1O1_07728 [Capronia coronata CBS 617.96]EXJ81663.1 hypothetical protein A1O1_07728 [Capronia coronata CBS 617.96]
MSTLLRKVRSTINAAAWDPRNDADSPGRFVRSRLQKAQPEWPPETFPQQALDPNNLSVRQNQIEHHEHPFTEFRRRLARKASTFSLRTKRWKAELREREQEEEKKFEDLGDGLAHQRQNDTVRLRKQDFVTVSLSATGTGLETGLQSGSDYLSQLTSNVEFPPVRCSTRVGTEQEKATPVTTSEDLLISPSLQDFIRKEQEGYICLNQAGGKISAKMASEHTAAPPVPYTRLKEITESACDAALAGVKAYSHPETESWNTTIINSILGALVEETTQKSATASTPGQPQFKYVVNSTIIQHAATPSSPSDETKKTSGRRGMHAASGAYWNNEKDGMWSYKYPGADSKGLDVVIGIIWVWVG